MLAVEKTIKISSKGQITLPRQFREMLQSDIVRIVADQGLIKIEPVRDAAGSLCRYAGRYVPLKRIMGKVWEEALDERHLRR
jgi:bifunctional DNA-binding transcriptional regulator/antitoxin component of YhaV-PrlF toxin-antitoxin module